MEDWLRPLKSETENKAMNFVRQTIDPGDRWGTAIIAWIDICQALVSLDFPPPSNWNYWPAMIAGRLRPLSPLAGDMATALREGHVQLDDFLKVGRVLRRYIGACEREGLSY